ncbi:hypothetical protein QZH41_009621 [Actinostola sp. cb2023]|nr:hypothetical protein QZH41_009621 [Actinostola sp. cb2023]
MLDILTDIKSKGSKTMKEEKQENGECDDLQVEVIIFYADRLIRLVVEEALNNLPYEKTTVRTPTGSEYEGLSFMRGNCGVSIMRSETGATVVTAIEVLFEHGVKEENIILLTLFCTPCGELKIHVMYV